MTSNTSTFAGAAALAAVFVLSSGCSLVTIKSNVEPLPPDDLKTRVVTREFVSVFSDRVESAADEIAATSETPEVRRAALLWKIGAVEAARRSGMRQDPREALVDIWALSLQQRDLMRSEQGAALFGSHRSTALAASERLVEDVRALADRSVEPGLRALMRGTAEDYAQRFPLGDLDFDREPILPVWYEAAAERSRVAAVGTTPEVVQEVSGRLSSLGEGLNDTVRWRTELALAESEEEIKEVHALFQRLDQGLRSVIALSERSPELAATAARELQRELGPTLENLDRRWAESLVTLAEQRKAVVEDLERIQANFSTTVELERAALTEAVDQQRGAIMEEAGAIATEVTERVSQEVRQTVREALILLIVLTVIILALPFGAGYLVGRTRARFASS